MPSHRPERLAEAIREVVSRAILFEVSDPRVRNVTVLGIEVAPDLRQAVVRVSVMGTESQQRQALRGLRSAAGFLQSRLANRLDARYTPVLSFEKDDGVKRSISMSRLIDEVRAEDRRLEGGAAPEGEPESPDEPPGPPDEPPGPADDT